MNRTLTIAKFVAPVVLAATLIGTLIMPSMAQPPMGVNTRLHNQNARINQGLRAHDLTRSQAQHLRARDRSIHSAEARDRRHDHGHLTAAERSHLEHRLNNTSNSIYARKRAGR